MIRIRTARLQVDGTIAVDGITNELYFAGGASGGSVYIVAERLQGSGVIRANGSDTGRQGDNSSGAGGGGRIAVYYGDKSGFVGDIQASAQLVRSCLSGCFSRPQCIGVGFGDVCSAANRLVIGWLAPRSETEQGLERGHG